MIILKYTNCNKVLAAFKHETIDSHRLRADKEKTQKVPRKNNTYADYADDIAILANTPNQV